MKIVKIKTAVTLSGAIVLLIGCSGCLVSNKNKTMGDLVEHFKENGIIAQYEPMFASVFGAVDAGYYRNYPSFYSKLYKFDERKKAESFAKLAGEYPRFVNGYFVMECNHESVDLLLPVFNSF